MAAIAQTAGMLPVLKKASELNASDVHCMVDFPPVFRSNGNLAPSAEFPAYTQETLLKQIDELISEEQAKRYRDDRELDTSVVLPTGERFRVNVFWEKGNPALAARYIPASIPSLDDLLAPEAAYDFVGLNQGLVLVTGPTGAGKSTLIASMIEEINNTRKEHIITLEDPIEFLYASKQSYIVQRQFGQDFLSFPEGLKHILRQDPDIILVGEMRDLETISATITLAETGHLVFATLHTNSAPETIDRIVDAFPSHQQPQIRLQLAFVLRGIISQILIPKVDGSLIAAHEVLVNNTAIGNLIREAKTTQIPNVLYSSPDLHMNTLDQELHWLVNEGFITPETARIHARKPESFQ
ncbi:MAG: twitching motility protein PilT [Candidatus Uhrbacteria bacterium]